MSTEAVLRQKARLYFDTPGGDVAHASALYHDDVVLEFPQSGERFEGRDRFTEWRSRYPTDINHELRRLTVRHDLVIAEVAIRYEADGPTVYGVALLDFEGDRIARERIYVMEGWDTPDWRRPWRSDEGHGGSGE